MDRVPNKKIMCHHDVAPDNYSEQAKQAALSMDKLANTLDVWRHQRLEKEDYILRQLWPSATWCGDAWRS